MRRIILILLIITLVLSSVGFAFASDIKITLDGEEVTFTTDSGAPFIDENGRTLVPLRVVLEKFNAEVTWSDTEKMAIVEKDGVRVSTIIGMPHIDVSIYNEDGTHSDDVTSFPIDTAAVIKDSRTYLPIRAVMEAFGCTVSWNAGTQTVGISSDDISVTPMPTAPQIQPPRPEVQPPTRPDDPPAPQIQPPRPEVQPPTRPDDPPAPQIQPPRPEVQPPTRPDDPPAPQIQPPRY